MATARIRTPSRRVAYDTELSSGQESRKRLEAIDMTLYGHMKRGETDSSAIVCTNFFTVWRTPLENRREPSDVGLAVA